MWLLAFCLNTGTNPTCVLVFIKTLSTLFSWTTFTTKFGETEKTEKVLLAWLNKEGELDQR
jgi:hypothetical protein